METQLRHINSCIIGKLAEMSCPHCQTRFDAESPYTLDHDLNANIRVNVDCLSCGHSVDVFPFGKS
jgi:hypothetical protein